MAASSMHFEPSARLQRYLGRELIADPNLAVIEFVKNAYDAGAKSVVVEFRLTSTPPELLICDDGVGMDEASFRANWLRPGFSEKSLDYAGPSLFSAANDAASRRLRERAPAGEKGLGRLAAGRLGDVMEVWTRPSDSVPWMHVTFDWSTYEDMMLALNEVDIPYDFDTDPPAEEFESGTIVLIRALRQPWTGRIPGRPARGRARTRLGRLKQDLQYLVRPLEAGRRYFSVNLKSDSVTELEDIGLVTTDTAQVNADYVYRFSVDTDEADYVVIRRSISRSEAVAREVGKAQEENLGEATINSRTAKAEDRPETLFCGSFSGRFVYTPPPAARRASKVDASATGVLLYRDGILVEPYGLPGDDWIGVEARKASRQGHAAIQPATFSGYVEISREDNPDLEDMSNRLGLLDNEASEDLVRHVRAEFAHFEDLVYEELVKPRWRTPAAKATAQAKQAGELATVRLRATAHSAGQPLQALGFDLVQLKGIARRSDVPEDVREELLQLHSRMATDLNRLGGTISRFMDEKPPQFKEIAVAQLVSLAVAEVQSMAADKNVMLSVDQSLPKGAVIVPAELIVGAIQELLTNAIEVDRPSGRPPKVAIRASDDSNGTISIVVSDNGIGIPGKHAGDGVLGIRSTSGRPAEGLPIVENSVKVSGGSVLIQRTGAEGTDICIELRRERRHD